MPFGGNFHPEWGALAPAPSFMRTARIVAVATAIGATAGAAVVLSLAGSSGALGPLANSDAVADKPLVIVHSLVQPAEAASGPARSAPSSNVAAAAVSLPATEPGVAGVSANKSTALPPTGVAVVAVSAPAVAPTAAAASAQPLSAIPAQPSNTAQVSTPLPSESHTTSTPAPPASIAALAEIPPTTEASPAPAPDQATLTLDQTAAQKVGSKKPRSTDPSQSPHPQTTVANTAQSSTKRRPEERGFGQMLRHLFSARTGSTSQY